MDDVSEVIIYKCKGALQIQLWIGRDNLKKNIALNNYMTAVRAVSMGGGFGFNPPP